MTTTTHFLRPSSLKLGRGGYTFEGCQTSLEAAAEQLESRMLPQGVCFKQNVLGHVVLGHTTKDKHGRWAMEFEVGRVWSEGDEESLTPYKHTPERAEKTVLRKRRHAPVVAKPWWKIW